MLYPVLVRKLERGGYAAALPDFPAVNVRGSTLAEALGNVQAGVEAVYEGAEELPLPEPTPFEQLLGAEQGQAVVLHEVSFDFLNNKAVPVNITLPVYLRDRIDKAAKAAGMTRSGYLAAAARAYEANKGGAALPEQRPAKEKSASKRALEPGTAPKRGSGSFTEGFDLMWD